MFLKSIILFIFVTLFLVSTTYAKESKIINISNEGFDPKLITIELGDEIIFKNLDSSDHWPASNIHPTHDIYPEFDPQEPIKAGNNWGFEFNKSGVWRYHDHLNPLIGGVIVVKEGNEIAHDQKSDFLSLSKLASRVQVYFIKAYISLIPNAKENYIEGQNLKNLIEKKDEAKLLLLTKLYDPEKIISKLFRESDNARIFNCHTYAHTVGRLYYKTQGELALQKYIPLCHSGYQHGVIAAFIQNEGESELISNVDNVCNSASSEFAKLTCYHGAGHGLMAQFNNELPEAILKCGEFNTEFKKSNCYVGVFMENIGSWSGDSLTSHKTNWLNLDDPHYPCNKLLDEKLIQKACYAIQPNWMYFFYKRDISKVREECSKVTNEEHKLSCYYGFGQQLGLIYLSDFSKIMAECNNVPKNDFSYNQCIQGSQRVVMDFWGTDVEKHTTIFCNELENDDVKYWCFERLKKRLTDLNI